MLAKGIKFYVGKFELSDIKISLRLTIEDNRNGTLNISKWIKSKGKKYKIVEFYFTSFEADTLILSGELLYDIKYLVKKQKRSCFIYPINSLPDGVLFCDENTKRIELIEKKGSVNRTVSRLCFLFFALICVQISYLHTNKRSLSQAKLHNLEPISKFYSKLL